jgi:TonB family protein
MRTIQFVASPILALLLLGGVAYAAPSKPKILESTAPVYPESSRRAQEQGDVMVRVLVSREGQPLAVTLARTSGFPSLDAAALEAAKQWKYSAGTDDAGKAIEAPIQFNVRFALDDSPPPPPAFDLETRSKIEHEWYNLIDLSVIVDRTWRRCRSPFEPAKSVVKFREFYEALAPEISVRESYLQLYFKDHPKKAVDEMIRREKQISAAVTARFIENATLHQKSPKTWCEPFMAGAQAAMGQFMQKKEVDWRSPEVAMIGMLRTKRRELMEPRR